MGWLSYTDDEILAFHPEFESAAGDALSQVSHGASDEWRHHPRVAIGTVPDYVLVDRSTGRWIVVVEIKRTRSAVFSPRFQAQAKGYAEANQAGCPPGRPMYFALTNLEITLLCALNGSRPPSECIVEDGLFDSGSFATDSAQDHRSRFVADLSRLVTRACDDHPGVLSIPVWPNLIELWLRHSDVLEQAGPEQVREPTWRLVVCRP